ncbi:hypothetical protein JTE90_000947 [Oedothorax gibbosus]|uniref:Uncharacterized protein n=1 Tax=Oedothorax gibbosus TaxID=931172 RepID=A0AAV6U7F5_9ARAC|nr:hypothetical protein JTE90_000947 [Oedothorax gibbosus]
MTTVEHDFGKRYLSQCEKSLTTSSQDYFIINLHSTNVPTQNPIHTKSSTNITDDVKFTILEIVDHEYGKRYRSQCRKEPKN